MARRKRENWVSQQGGLPRVIRRAANHIKRKNPSWSESRAIATAVAAIKKGAATGDLNFKGRQQMGAKGRARYAAGAASWYAKRARARATPNR